MRKIEIYRILKIIIKLLSYYANICCCHYCFCYNFINFFVYIWTTMHTGLYMLIAYCLYGTVCQNSLLLMLQEMHYFSGR